MALFCPAVCGAEDSQRKFIQTAAVVYGGNGEKHLQPEDAAALARFDLLDIARYRFSQINGNTYAAIKAINPQVQIYSYLEGQFTRNDQDGYHVSALSTLGRHNISRGHSMGSLNADNPQLFLLDALGQRIFNIAYSNPGENAFSYLMDFGSTSYLSYFLESVRTDVVGRNWQADGLFVDDLSILPAAHLSGTPVVYPDQTSWITAMQQFSTGLAEGLQQEGLKMWANMGNTRNQAGADVWLALDAQAPRPDVVMEEGAFVVSWGSGDAQFLPEADWKRQVDLLGAIKNFKVTYLSHVDLDEDAEGIDNFGKRVTFWQAFYYALGSYLLGKNEIENNSYFMFFNSVYAYSLARYWWFPEYDKIDLGAAQGEYAVTVHDGVNVYSRKFERGYVYVNPTSSKVSEVSLPEACLPVTHDAIEDLSSILPVSVVDLPPHSATILMHVPREPEADEPEPEKLKVTASSRMINGQRVILARVSMEPSGRSVSRARVRLQRRMSEQWKRKNGARTEFRSLATKRASAKGKARFKVSNGSGYFRLSSGAAQTFVRIRSRS